MGGLGAVVGLLCTVPDAGWAGEFRFVDQWQAGELPAYGRVSMGLASVKPAALRRGLRQEGATVRYAVLSLRESPGVEVPVVVAVVEREGQETLVTVDMNADGRLARDEQARRASGKELPPGFGQAGEPVWIADLTKPRPRTVALRLSGLSTMVTCAVRGYARGRLPLGGHKREAILVDDDGDLLLEAGRDSLYLDLDGNGAFDRRAERFPVLERVAVGEAAFRFTLGVPLEAASWRVAPTGSVPVRFTIGALKGQVESISASFSEASGHTLRVTTLEKPVDMPAGLYQTNGLLLRVLAEDRHLWTYTFVPAGGRAIEIAPPEGAAPDTPVVVDLLGELSFRIASTGTARPGRELSLESTVLTSTGLRLAGAERGGSRVLPGPLRVLAPDGRLLEEKPYSFG